MSPKYRTCKHTYDTGQTCNSAAVKKQNYCAYHVRHRARLMRMAQYRARNQRLPVQLPPLENMHAVCSALNQLGEAANAGMVELKTARFLLSVLRTAGHFLLHADRWQANPYHSEEPAEVDLTAEFGLPKNLDLDTPPELAFPPSALPTEPGAPPFSAPGAPPFSAPLAERVGSETDNFPMPHSGAYCGTHQSHECDCLIIREDHPITPEMLEVTEITETQGSDAGQVRFEQLQRNRARRQLRTERKRFAQAALRHNLRIAAQKLAERKLAELAAQPAPAPDPGKKAAASSEAASATVNAESTA